MAKITKRRILELMTGYKSDGDVERAWQRTANELKKLGVPVEQVVKIVTEISKTA